MTFLLESVFKDSGPTEIVLLHILPANLTPSHFLCDYEVGNAHIQGHTCLSKCWAYFGSNVWSLKSRGTWH